MDRLSISVDYDERNLAEKLNLVNAAILNKYRFDSFKEINTQLTLIAQCLSKNAQRTVSYYIELGEFGFGHFFYLKHSTQPQEISNGKIDVLQHAEDMLNYRLRNDRPLSRASLCFIYWWKKQIKALRKQGLG